MADDGSRKTQRRKSLGVFGPNGLLGSGAATSSSPALNQQSNNHDRPSTADGSRQLSYNKKGGIIGGDGDYDGTHKYKDTRSEQKRPRISSRNSLFGVDFTNMRNASAADNIMKTQEGRKVVRKNKSVNGINTHAKHPSTHHRTARTKPRLPHQEEQEHKRSWPSSLRSHAAEPNPNPTDITLSYSPAEPTTHSQPNLVQRSVRNSVFGSLGSFISIDDDQRSIKANSKNSSCDEEDLAIILGLGGSSNNNNTNRYVGSKVIHHGEVQTTAMWRKKNQYLVLTETHLVRFKSQSKASEVFPSIPASWGRGSGSAVANRQSIVSLASLQDSQGQAGGTSGEGEKSVALNNIIAVHRLDDGKPYFSIDVCYVDERSPKGVSLHIQLNDPQEARLWLVGVRAAAENARSLDPLCLDLNTVEYVARTLEQERDYDPDCFRVYKVVHRAAAKPNNHRTPSDEVVKLASNACLLAIGVHKIHILPLQPKISNRASIISLAELDLDPCLGFMSLSSISLQPNDDSFQLIFRVPFNKPSIVNLSSASSAEIVLFIRQRAEFLRPEWIHQPFSFIVSSDVEAEVTPPATIVEDYGCFDRTLIAYCAAYGVDTSRIRYTVDYTCDDGPCFQLLPPDGSRDGKGYLPLELMAVMRTLRYNESFGSISFSNVNLDGIQDLRDPYGTDYDALRTRSNVAVKIAGQENISALTREIRALCLKSRYLRRMNFSFCLTRIPKTEKRERDPGCGIPEAIFPLCRRKLTYVDWVTLNGIKLGESDLDYLVDAASQAASGLRALEVSHCNIAVHDLDLILTTLRVQETTLESISISGVVGRLSPELFQQQIGFFPNIRKVNLSHVSRTSGIEPLIAPETLLSWELEELSLSHTNLNSETVDSIAAYLSSPKSRALREIRLNQCNLTGRDVAAILYFSANERGQARNIHIHVNENRLHIDCDMLFDSIAQNRAPTRLSMKMQEFQSDEDFKHLVEALTVNTTLKYLDISKASLPYDASTETSKALQRMFEQNSTIEELDISGEYSHLDVTKFGIGLNIALTGLKKNRTLKALKIEHQKLDFQGANTLASVIEANDSLVEIYCENNEINLQAFTVLVNALQQNRTILHLPLMARDRELCLRRVQREMEADARDQSSIRSTLSTTSSIRRSIREAFRSSSGSSRTNNKLVKTHVPTRQPQGPGAMRRVSSAPLAPATTGTPTPLSTLPQFSRQEIEFAIEALRSKWDKETLRMQRYLYRNYTLLNNAVEEPDFDTASDGRPATAASLATFLNQLGLNQNENTNVENGNPGSEIPNDGQQQQQQQQDGHPDVHAGDGESSTSQGEYRTLDPRQSSNVSPFLSPSISPGPDQQHQEQMTKQTLPLNTSTTTNVPLPESSDRKRLPPPTATSSIRSRKTTSTANVSVSTDADKGVGRMLDRRGSRIVGGRTAATDKSATGSPARRLLNSRPSSVASSKKEIKNKGKGKNKENDNEPPTLDWNLPELKF